MTEFDKYIRQGEPNQKEKATAWQVAIGLQDVDGLKPSEYLIQTAQQHIEGDISIDEVKHLIDTYYQSKSSRGELEDERTEEADKVSARITELLSEKTFSFTPEYLLYIHRRLFEGLYKYAGQIRNYNITKKEWVLDGDTVIYSDYEMIRPTLEYEFAQEKSTDYPATNAEQALQRISKFISGIWQVHAFGEGNTRTIAVFLMKYLKTFGFKVDNDIFKKHSWYFRNALVRANYNNYTKGVSANTKYLEMFLRNMLFEEENNLSNREMNINFSQSAKEEESKSQNGTLNGTLNCSLDEMALLNFLKKNPKATQTNIAEYIGKSERTVKRMTPSLIERGLLERINGKGDKGSWVVKIKDKD